MLKILKPSRMLCGLSFSASFQNMTIPNIVFCQVTLVTDVKSGTVPTQVLRINIKIHYSWCHGYN